MTPHRMRTSLRIVAVALAAGIAVPASAAAVMGDAPDAHVAFWGVEVARGGTPIIDVAPGRQITVPLGVKYDADAATPGPVTVAVTLPAGLQYVGADALVPEAPGVTAVWACDPQGQRVQCELRTGDGAAPYVLHPDHGVHLTMRAVANDVPLVPPGGDPVAVGDITAEVSVPEASGALSASATASVVASHQDAAPRIHVSHVTHDPIATAGTGAREGYDLHVHNVGDGPARTAGRRPAVVLRGVVPSIAVKDVTVEGEGWRCRPAAHFTCSYGRRVAQGATAPPLRVRWAARHDAAAIDEAWEIEGVIGYASEQGTPASLPFTRETRISLASTVVQLGVHARVPDGLHVVGGHAPRQMHLGLANVGGTHARTAGVQLQVPAGVSVAPVTPGWHCTGASQVVRCMAPRPLAVQQVVPVVVALSAPHDVRPGPGAVVVAPIGPRGAVRGASHEVPIMLLDPGDPEVTPTVSFRTGGVWKQWRDGGAQLLGAGDVLTYRINLESTGGVPVRPGDHVTVRQPMGVAMGAVSALGGPGVRCAAAGVSCTVDVGAPVAPGAQVGVITVTAHPTTVGAQSALGAITTTVEGARDRETLRMNVEVVDNPDSLRPGMRVVRDPSVGGTGSMVMVVVNTGTSAVHAVHAVAALPTGLRATGVRTPTGWACRPSGSRVSCTYRGTVAPGARTPGVTIDAAATGARAATHVVGVSADGRAADGALQRGRRRGAMPVRGPIAAHAMATPRVVTATGNTLGRRVALDGSASTGNGTALDYRWSQRCLTPADAQAVPQCRGVVVPLAPIADATLPSTSAELPSVAARTTFVFSLEITDGSATRRSLTSVVAAVPHREVGRAGRASGLAPADAAARADIIARVRAGNSERRAAARRARAARRAKARDAARSALVTSRNVPHVTITPGPVLSAGQGDDVTLQAGLTGTWADGVTYEWAQVSGPTAELTPVGAGEAAVVNAPDAQGPILLRVVATDTAGHSDTSQVEVMVGAPPSTQGGEVLLSAFRAARASASLPIALGNGITGTLRNLAGSRSGDTGSYAFRGSDLAVGQLSLQGVAGTVDASMITLTSGTLVLPDAWRIAPVAITRTAPLVVQFATAGTRASLVGRARAPGSFPLFALPAGWAGSSTLEFAPGAWRLAAAATGDEDGAATVRGSVWADGTYEVSVEAPNLIDIAGRRVALAGAAGNHTGTARNTVEGSINTPIELGDGVRVQALTATWAVGTRPKGTPAPIIRGAAALVIASGDAAPLEVTSSLSYESPLDWRLALVGRGGDPWAPLPGLRIAPADLSGYVGDDDGARQWAVTGTVRDWRASSVIGMSGVRLSISDVCAYDGAPACPDAGLFMRLQGRASLTSAVTGVVTAPGDAVLGLGDGGGFSLSAALGDLQLGPGVRLGSPALDVSYAMPRTLLPGAVGRPGFTDDTTAGFGVRAIGALALPSVGTYASVTADATERGWTLGAYAPTGVALGPGNGMQSKAWFGWASYDTQMQAPVDGGDPIVAPVARNTVSVAGMYSAADWFRALVATSPAAAPSVIRLDPANGSVTGDVALAGDFALPVGASQLTASGVVLGIRGTAAGVTVSARARGDLRVKGADGTLVAAPPLEMALSGDGLLHTATGMMKTEGGGDWTDAFGVPGLTVRGPSLALSVDTTSRAATLRLMGAAAIPAGLSGALHTPTTGAPMSVAADLAAPDSCVNVQVGSTTGSQAMVGLAGGALRARYYEFVVAPTGCRLSATSPVLRPGLSLVFDAEVMGTTVDVAAPIALAPHLVLDDTVGIGPLLVGALRLGDAQVKIGVNGGTGAEAVGLSGNATMFNTPIRVAGDLTGGDATTGTLVGRATAPIDASGFPVRNLLLQVAVRSAAAGTQSSVAASGDITMMGDSVHVPAFTAVVDNGVVEDVRFTQQATVNIHGRATASGLFTMHHRASNRQMTVGADVAFTTPAGIAVGTAAAPAHMVIGPQCASLSGDTTIAGVATATVSGTIAHADGCTTAVRTAAGATVTPATGDFSLFADRVMVTVDTVWNWGSVAIGNIGGTAYANLATSLALSPQDTNTRVPVAGAFTPGGDFVLTGAETVDAAGFAIPLTVTAKREGGTTRITGAGTVDVAGNQVAITGTFTHEGGTPHTVFVGNVPDLVLGGYHLGNAKLTLVDTATEKGFNADVVSKLGSDDGAHVIAEGHITLMHAPDGTVLYHGSLNGELSVPDLKQEMDGVVDITNCTESCTKVAPTSYILNTHLSKWSYSFTFKVSFDAGGAFSASSETSRNSCSGEVDLFVFYARGCFDTKIKMTIGNAAPYFSLTGSASVSAEIKAWYTGYDWEGFSISASARVQLDPFGVCVSMAGHDLCV